jgi:vacuolar-type H+-ATPase subunit E/Vma4
MKQTDEDIKALSRAVISDARGDAEQNLAEAKAKAEGIRKRAEEDAAAERTRILQKASQEAGRLRGQAIASAQLKARTTELEQREKLLEQVFGTARQQLSSVQKSTDYEKTALRLLNEALVQLGADKVKVRADATTQQLFSPAVLERVSKELNIQVKLGEPLKQGTGVIVETEDGRRQYDNTLETRLARLQGTLRSPVFHLLMGEPL